MTGPLHAAMSGRLVAADMEDSNRASELGAEGSSDAAEKGVHPDPSQPAVLSPLLRHYDPTQDIVLRVECVSDEAMKVRVACTACVNGHEVACSACLGCTVRELLKPPPSPLTRTCA